LSDHELTREIVEWVHDLQDKYVDLVVLQANLEGIIVPSTETTIEHDEFTQTTTIVVSASYHVDEAEKEDDLPSYKWASGAKVTVWWDGRTIKRDHS